MLNWFDVHTHLNMLECGPQEGLSRAMAAGIQKVITIGTGPDDWPTVLSLSRSHPGKVYSTLGVHPHDANLYTETARDYILNEIGEPSMVAIGEIGLDYYYNNSPKGVQIKAFEEQLEIASSHDLPVEIHTRDADTDTADILRKFNGRVRGLLHCFTSSWELAKVALDVGFDISISGVVTFKNAQSLRDTVTKIPLDRLHVETDAPFLAPVPHRGKKNEPAWVVHVAECVAQLKNVGLDELSEATRANALDLFPRMKLS